jgi:hypothetical protein
MDRVALVRLVRRRQALDALAFERDRATLLREQVEETVALLEGQRVDADLYGRLSLDDVSLVRAAFGDLAEPDAAALDFGSGDEGDDELEWDPAVESEEEIARLQQELEQSIRTQAALERYLEVLDSAEQASTAEPAA